MCAVLCASGELRDTAGGRGFMRGEAVAGAVRTAVSGVLRGSTTTGGKEEDLIRAGGSREVVRLLGEGLAGCEQGAAGRVANLLGELLREHPDEDGALALLRLDLALHGSDTVRGLWTALSPALLLELGSRAASLLHAHMYVQSLLLSVCSVISVAIT